MPPVPPELSVGDGLESDGFLKRDGLADASVFDGSKIRTPDPLTRFQSCLQKFGRSQKAADMIGMKKQFLRYQISRSHSTTSLWLRAGIGAHRVSSGDFQIETEMIQMLRRGQKPSKIVVEIAVCDKIAG